MTPLYSMDEIRAAAAKFFASDAMTFFNARAADKVYPLPAAHKTVFITSEEIDPTEGRVYSVRVIDWDTHDLTTMGVFGGLPSMKAAKAFCEWLVAGCGWLPNDMRLGGKGTKAWRDPESGVLHVTYYDTEIVTADPDARRVVLNNGGFTTMTTKTRMTQAAHQFGLGYQVHEREGQWFAYREGREFKFNDEGRCLVEGR